MNEKEEKARSARQMLIERHQEELHAANIVLAVEIRKDIMANWGESGNGDYNTCHACHSDDLNRLPDVLRDDTSELSKRLCEYTKLLAPLGAFDGCTIGGWAVSMFGPESSTKNPYVFAVPPQGAYRKFREAVMRALWELFPATTWSFVDTRGIAYIYVNYNALIETS